MKDDKTDAILREAMNKSGLSKVDIKRLGSGKYQFGSRVIQTKMDNDGNVAIHVGEDYVDVSEFIDQYKQAE